MLLSNLTLVGWSELHGPGIKSAMCRQAAPFFAELARTFFQEATPHDSAVVAVTSSLAELYVLFDQSPMFLTDDAVARASDLVLDLGSAYQRLRAHSRTHGQLFWQVKHKAHMLQHLPFFAGVINPRIVSCYAAEGQMGTSSKVWARSMSGAWGAHAQHTVLVKRSLALWLRLELNLC
ncbi:MAG: hypothetical protein GY697_17435 [Desulfobacterales bacterium]|nr:hypothetical protein [Desulfobacterales bacterium]